MKPKDQFEKAVPNLPTMPQLIRKLVAPDGDCDCLTDSNPLAGMTPRKGNKTPLTETTYSRTIIGRAVSL